MDLRLLIHRNVIFGACPKCKQEMTLERVKTNNKWEKTFLSIIKFKKYHCKSCKWYGNMFIYVLPKNYRKVILNYIILISIVVLSSMLLSMFVKKIFIP